MNNIIKVGCLLGFTLLTIHAKGVSHIERVWKDEYFTEAETILTRTSGRPFTVSVEGNVGSGKSTFLEFFRGYPDISVYQEPVDFWTNFNGTDFLGLVYNDTKRWGLAFQSLVALSMLETHRKDLNNWDGKDHPSVKIMERSMHSGRYCFIEQMKNAITPGEYHLLDYWYDIMQNTTDVDVDAIIYLRTTPEVIYERINKRNRTEEATIPLSYLQDLHQRHEDWLIHQNATTDPLPPVIIVNSDEDIRYLKMTYRQLAKDIYTAIPDILRTGKHFRYCSKHC